ncbi:alpha/beta hydrolase [Novosphingobium sp.]|uniref:alpha/beta hydrolase n=1 Tax=Novosphingobium sp. TaxID=1874826 RepID=UPI0038BB37F4
MPLNPAFLPILEAMAPLAGLDWEATPPASLRAMMDNPLAVGDVVPVERVEELTLPLPGRDVPARLYVPQGHGALPPLTLYFHGGGWVIGTLDTHDATCRELAVASGSAVLSVGYRLAPEAAYPLPLDDCHDALVWAAANGEVLGVDATRLAVAGDSAGGNLAAAVAIRARDEGGPALRHQLLIYPVTDADFATPSYAANGGGGYFLGTSAMRAFWTHYLGETPVEQAPLAAVLRQPDLAGLAPATVITAEFDPLRDEGNAYADRLVAAGVSVDHAQAPGMIHGFFSMSAMVPDAQQWIARAGANLASALA